MKVRNMALALGAVALILVLGSCDALFSNQFKTWGLGQVTNATINTAVTDGDVAAILEQSGLEQGGISDSFLNAATQDPETADAVKALLQETIDNAAANNTPPETVQAAQVLIIEIDLEMNGGGDFISNIVDAVAAIDFQNFDFSNPETITNIFAALFPSRQVKTLPEGWTRADIALLINNVAGMRDSIDALIATFQANGDQFLPNGVDVGWIAQVGAVVRILNLVEPNITNYNDGNGNGDVGAALAALIDDGTSYPNSVVIGNYITNTDTLLNAIVADDGLNALLLAAGWDLPAIIAANS
jgi:hypothetical protein